MSAPFPRSNLWRAILWGGLLGGTGDLLFAFIYYGWKIQVFQNVTGGLIGRQAAFAGGVPSFALGVFLHYVIAFIWAALFWALSHKFPPLVKHAIPAGLAYGLVIFYGMNSVVLPLSALHTKAWPLAMQPWPIAAHMLLVGLPIALVAKKYARSNL
jgi:hypothetical protein